jgi:hypothetical protein
MLASGQIASTICAAASVCEEEEEEEEVGHTW